MTSLACRLSAFLALVFIWSMPAQAVEPDEILDDPVLEETARKISKELRCMVCQNQSIDDSDAEMAKDLRILVRQRLLAGDTEEEVKDYVVARYGEFVLLKPVVAGHTALLWVSPLILSLLGLWLAWGVFRRPGEASRAE